jgi:molybdopterin biosynthesis enzyme
MIVAGTFSFTITKRCTFDGFDFQMCSDAAGTIPVNITGYNAKAEVRTTPGAVVVIDLGATIPVGTDGIVHIPEIDDETTDTYTAGNYQWDLLLEDGSDNRQRVLAGTVTIINPVTDST